MSSHSTGAHGLTIGTTTHVFHVIMAWLLNRTFEGLKVVDFGCGGGDLLHCALALGAAEVFGNDLLKTLEFILSVFGENDNVHLKGADMNFMGEVRRSIAIDGMNDVDVVLCLIGINGPTMQAISAFLEPTGLRVLAFLVPCSGSKQVLDCISENTKTAAW